MIDYTFEITSDIHSLKKEWLHLDDSASQLIEEGKLPYIQYSFYQTYGWNEFLFASYRYSNTKRICYVISREGEKIVSILPLVINLRKHTVSIANGGVAGILNVASLLYLRDDAELIMRQLGQYLIKQFPHDTFTFHSVPISTPFFKGMKEFSSSITTRGSYHIPLSEFGSFENYFQSLSKNVRQNIRTAYNRIKKDGRELSLEVYNETSKIPTRVLFKIWSIYYKRKLEWHRRSAPFLLKTIPRMRALWEILFGRNNKSVRDVSNSCLYVLKMDNEIIAFMYVFLHDQHAIVPKLAISSDYSHYSPGYILIAESIKEMFKRGIVDMDLCRGDEEYKTKVGGINEPLGKIEIAASSI